MCNGKEYQSAEYVVVFMDTLVESIKDYGIPEKTEGAHINLLLKMLLHYDETKKVYVLNSSIALANLLYKKNNSITNYINLCQAIKRKQALSKQDINRLGKDEVTGSNPVSSSILKIAESL